MGNRRKVWLACGAAVGLPLSGIAQDVKQVQVSETNGRVEIHVVGENLPKPSDVTWNRDTSYTLEWKAGLRSPGGRIRVDAPNVKSVWYGWFTAHPHAVRVKVQTKSAIAPELTQTEDGWTITIADKPDAVAKVSKPTKVDKSYAEAAGEVISKPAPAKVAVLAPTTLISVIKPKAKIKVVASTTPESEMRLPALPMAQGTTMIVESPAMKKWATIEQLDKAQIKKTVASKPAVESIPVSAPKPMVVNLGQQDGLRRVTLDVSNADLAQVLKGLAIQSGANIVIGPKVDGKVTADLHDVTIEQALQEISYITGVKYEKVDGVYMFGTPAAERPVEHIAQPNVVRVVPILSDAQEEVKSVLEAKYRGQDLQVLTPTEKNAKPKNPSESTQSVVPNGDSNSLVMPESHLIVIGPADIVDEAVRDARSVDLDIVKAHDSYQKTDRIDHEMRAYEVKFADPRALREALINEIPGLRAVIAPNSVATFGVYHEGVSKRQSNEDNSQATGSQNGQNGANQSQSSENNTVSSVSTTSVDDSTLEEPFTKEEGVSVPMKLVLRGTHEQIQQAMEYLKLLDTPPHQVAIEMRVMELTKEDALNAGIDWNILTGGAVKVLNLNNSQANPSNTVSASLSGSTFNGDVTASLDGLVQRNKLLARPNLVAMDGRQSEIFIGDIIRYVQSITQSQNGTTVTTGEVPVGVRLSVLPRVGADGNMTLDLRPRISLLTSFTQVTGGGELPQTSTRYAQDTINLKSGQTIAIGGLIQDQDVKTLSGIPILMNLPIIGSLFRSTTTSKQRTELVIFLTARSLNGPVGTESLPMSPDSQIINGGKH